MRHPVFMIQVATASATRKNTAVIAKAMPISAVVPSSRLVPPRVRVVLDALEALRERKR